MRYDNAEVQFLYPFEISDWRNFKRLVLEILDLSPFKENPGRPEMLIDLEKTIPSESVEEKEFKTFQQEIEKGDIKNTNELFELVEDKLHRDNGYDHGLFKTRLKKLKEKYHDSADKRFFYFLQSIIENNETKVVFEESEKFGTRPYLLKNVPHIFITPSSTDLIIENIDAFPNIKEKLNRNKDDMPIVRIQTNIKLLASGFGLLKVRCCLFTKKGLDEAIEEIIFSSETKSCIDSEKIWDDKKILVKEIEENILDTISARNQTKNSALNRINKSIEKFCHKHCLTSHFIKQNIVNLIERANVLPCEFSTSEIVDIQNLDRGSGWGKEPQFQWSSNGDKFGPGKLYNYFDNLINKTVVDPIKKQNQEKLSALLTKSDNAKLKNNLSSTLSHLERDNSWYATEGIYPYIMTFVSAPKDFKKPGTKHLSNIEEHFSRQLENPENKMKLARLLMRTPWKKMRLDLEPLKNALQNIFYSDLLFMAVNIRSTLCFYYHPDNPAYEYRKYPELYYSIKYKRELEDTLAAQRTLWYMYSTFNHKVSQEIKSISKTFESLTDHIRKEEFDQILEELSEITMGIDNRKIAISEIMEDPLNRKGSTLFAEILSKSSKSFRLRQMYLTLNDKLERLDMLGLHVNQTTNELSSLVIQETTRATQFTIEILEAFVIGVYVAEIVKLSSPAWLDHLSTKPFIFFTIAIAIPLISLPLITLIRKSMSRFRGRQPAWLEWVEKIGFGAGLAMLSGLAFLVLRQLHFIKNNIVSWGLLIGLPVLLYVVWHKVNSAFRSKY